METTSLGLGFRGDCFGRRWEEERSSAQTALNCPSVFPFRVGCILSAVPSNVLSGQSNLERRSCTPGGSDQELRSECRVKLMNAH